MNGITEYTVAEMFDYIHRVIKVTFFPSFYNTFFFSTRWPYY